MMIEPNPPVRESNASLVVVVDPLSPTECLLKWNPNSHKYSMPGGKHLTNEDDTTCAKRELSVGLGLEPESMLKLQRFLQLERQQTSESANVATDYYWYLFQLPIATDEIDCSSTHDPAPLCWVSQEEIDKGFTRKGHPISKQATVVWTSYRRQGLPIRMPPWEVFRQWVRKVLHMSEMRLDNATYSWEIRERRLRYRVLDRVLYLIGLRHVPKECSMTFCQTTVSYRPNCATPTTVGEAEIPGEWLAIYHELHSLIRHDDQLNWTKFHYVLAINGAIATLAGYLLVNGLYYPAICAGILGTLVAWQADLTFQEGLRCLRAHRAKLTALESRLLPGGAPYTFRNNPFNQRDALEMSPAIMSVLFAILCIASLSLQDYQKPPDKHEGTISVPRLEQLMEQIIKAPAQTPTEVGTAAVLIPAAPADSAASVPASQQMLPDETTAVTPAVAPIASDLSQEPSQEPSPPPQTDAALETDLPPTPVLPSETKASATEMPLETESTPNVDSAGTP